MTVAIGDEIRESSALAEKMNNSFDSTRVRLRGTMNRMLIMAERTGVGWRVWLLFFAAVAMLFFYVWLRATLPRFRFDQLMGLAWKVLIPLSLLNIMLTAFFRLVANGQVF